MCFGLIGGRTKCGLLWAHYGGCAVEGLVWAGVLKCQVFEIKQPHSPTGGELKSVPFSTSANGQLGAKQLYKERERGRDPSNLATGKLT